MPLKTRGDPLARAADAIASATGDAIGRLAGIEKELRNTSATEAGLGARFSECLARFHTEIERQQSDYAQRILELNAALVNWQGVAAPARGQGATQNDPATGLPERASAEAAIDDAIRERRCVFAAVFVLERLDMVNTRFGYGAGDQIFLLYGQDLAQQLLAADRLFRWTGPALLALLERGGDLVRARADARGIAAKRFSRTIEIDSRSVLLSIGVKSAVFPVLESNRETLIGELESFVRGTTPPPA